jgi:uncharacterized protein (DUF2252 family)
VSEPEASTPTERAEAGRAARRRMPRSRHGEWEPSPQRPDPVRTIERQDATRVAELVPIRHGRMVASPFPFFRGGAAIMAADLAAGPSSGLKVQLCGDAHLTNFGVFQAADRSLVFDVNDFDETLPGPFEWDVKRLAASLAIAGRETGLKEGQRRKLVLAAVGTYRKTIREFAVFRDVDVWYARLSISDLERFRSEVTSRTAKGYDKLVAKAQRKDSLRAFAKLTRRDGDRIRIVRDPPLIVPVEELVEAGQPQIVKRLEEFLAAYRDTLDPDLRQLASRYRYVHAARKVVGVGSVGTRAWIVLLLGRDSQDPLFLQVKEAEGSVLEPFAGASRYRHHGRRVVEGQRLMQATSDIFLGWLSMDGIDRKRRDFYVRQLWDGKGSVVVEGMTPQALRIYAGLCGWTLSRAHARSGDRIAIAAYLGGGTRFEEALASFAEAYADQNERDHRAFAEAIESGRLEAELGV